MYHWELVALFVTGFFFGLGPGTLAGVLYHRRREAQRNRLSMDL